MLLCSGCHGLVPWRVHVCRLPWEGDNGCSSWMPRPCAVEASRLLSTRGRRALFSPLPLVDPEREGPRDKPVASPVDNEREGPRDKPVASGGLSMVQDELGAVEQDPERVGQRLPLVARRAALVHVLDETLPFSGARL